MISEHNRQGELGDVPFRSNRFFCVGNKWYFSTREGFDSGPYANRERAESSLDHFIQIVTKFSQGPSGSHAGLM
jgi:hypothetical protein